MHKERGGFDFDIPLSAPKVKEVSEQRPDAGETGRRVGAIANRNGPDCRLHRGARRGGEKDWNALLAAMGFDATQAKAIRALEGIDADLEIFADRFLNPGAAAEADVRKGHGAVQGEGANSKGAKFVNYYWFAPCQGKLVLYSVTENPQ